MAEDFYWRNARDSLLTPHAIQMFQILATRDGEDLNEVKDEIDSEYTAAVGRTTEITKHGGLILTWVRAYQEAGWVELDTADAAKQIIKITDAGKQALELLARVPDFLKAAPYFVMELLTRFQLNNPARPSSSKDQDYDEKLSQSDIFPYWTLFKIMREAESYITSDELKRFVFKIQKSEEIDDTIQAIKEYRKDVASGLSGDELDNKYQAPLSGGPSEPKYIMGRLGTQVGKYPPVVVKDGAHKWILNDSYLPFIDEVIRNQPVFQEHLTENSWMAAHGQAVPFPAEEIPPVSGDEADEEVEELEDTLPDDDSIWLQTKDLIDNGASGIIFSGPPGTSKTWYASKIAIKLANENSRQIRYVQFHPSYSYEDFIEGYIPVSGTTGSGPSFEVRRKIFLTLCDAARRDPDNLYVIVIDEFSRGDPSRIFGETLTYLEKDYRNKKFILPYSGKHTTIPDNILVLGTMNPYDKSVSDLDDAMERRFDRIPMEPSLDILKVLLTASGMQNELMGKVIGFFIEANKQAPHGLGHTFFLNAKEEKDIVRLWNYKLKYIVNKFFPFEPEMANKLKEEYSKLVSKPEQLK